MFSMTHSGHEWVKGKLKSVVVIPFTERWLFKAFQGLPWVMENSYVLFRHTSGKFD